MRCAFALCVMLALVSSERTALAGDEVPTSKIPELKALDHYIGTWDVVITTQGFPFTKGQVTAKWVLDGRFIEQNGGLKSMDGSGGPKIKTLMTYDPAKKVYRSWTFLTDGATSESEGTWDAKARIMKSVSRKDEGGGYSTTTADFSVAGFETWTIVSIDGSGKVVSEFSGKNTRKSK